VYFVSLIDVIVCFTITKLLGAILKLRKVTVSFVMSSVCPHGAAQLPLDGFREQLFFESLSRKFQFH
jgi:hypothetical protein